MSQILVFLLMEKLVSPDLCLPLISQAAAGGKALEWGLCCSSLCPHRPNFMFQVSTLVSFCSTWSLLLCTNASNYQLQPLLLCLPTYLTFSNGFDEYRQLLPEVIIMSAGTIRKSHGFNISESKQCERDPFPLPDCLHTGIIWTHLLI